MKKFFIIICITLLSSVLPTFANTEEYLNLNWWKSFNDDCLIDNLITVSQNNYDLKNTALKIKENEQVVKMQFANELPSMTLSGDLSRDLQAPRQQMGTLRIPKYSQYNYNIPITAGYEIDIWGKNRFKTKSKKAQLEIIKQEQRATYISLTSDFASDYFNLIKADKLIELQEELIRTQEDLYKMVCDKYKAGLCTLNEVLVQEQFLTGLKEELNLHIQTREVLVNALKVYLVKNDGNIKRANYNDVVLVSSIPTKYNSDIILNRPDYKQDEYNMKRIGFDIKVARREFLPTFTIYGQIGLNSYHWSDFFNRESQFFNAGILPTFDLFSGGRKFALLKIKKYQYEQALNDYKKTLLVGVKEVNSSLVEYNTALKNYQDVQSRLNTESKLYVLAQDKYKIGASSSIDELLAKESHLIIQKEEVSNKINTIITTIGLYKATGGVDLRKINEDI
ncbi:TPA: hypothetical protein CPT80_04975 [Candidatus Gastranaerophilales bacterium HUM_9]|nr:MAG TPA: hypothetical protein CPT80_04975 [Candidatus Gastranaerophilales bacterium HUM_9]HBX34815.1 hypothetical protein [Cyanobacteria bacterium UBA11440]